MAHAFVEANENRPQAQVDPRIVAGQKLWSVRIYLSNRNALSAMDPFNLGILRYVSSLPTRQTVFKDAHEVFKTAITTQDCSWEERFLRNIEFNTLGISEAHVLKKPDHKHMRAFVAEMESVNEIRHLKSQPDFIYGWIPPRYMLDNSEIPVWSKVEAEAVNGTNLFYPFLVVKFDDLDNEQRGNLL